MREIEEEKKEQELKAELSFLRDEIKKLKKLNLREEAYQKIKGILISNGVLNVKLMEDKAEQIIDYLMYLLERESK